MTDRKKVKKGTRVVSRYRFVIKAVAPNTGNVLTLNVRRKFSSVGPFLLKTTYAQAAALMRKILKAHPETKAWGLHVEELERESKRKNPSGYAMARDAMLAEMDKASGGFEGFTGKRATHVTTHKIADGSNRKRAGFALGKLHAVTYLPNREGDPPGTLYEHKFRKFSQPLLVASDDGSRLEVIGGSFQVTDRGIEDR